MGCDQNKGCIYKEQIKSRIRTKLIYKNMRSCFDAPEAVAAALLHWGMKSAKTVVGHVVIVVDIIRSFMTTNGA